MKIETKYNCGDKVYNIQSRMEQVQGTCGFCNDTGRVTGQDKASLCCPKCNGRPPTTWLPRKYMVNPRAMTIGRLGYELTDNMGEAGSQFDNYKPQHKVKEEYMLEETGIGSGTVYKVEMLFPTAEEAQTECDKLNAEESDKEASSTIQQGGVQVIKM